MQFYLSEDLPVRESGLTHNAREVAAALMFITTQNLLKVEYNGATLPAAVKSACESLPAEVFKALAKAKTQVGGEAREALGEVQPTDYDAVVLSVYAQTWVAVELLVDAFCKMTPLAGKGNEIGAELPPFLSMLTERMCDEINRTLAERGSEHRVAVNVASDDAEIIAAGQRIAQEHNQMQSAAKSAANMLSELVAKPRSS